MCGFRQSNFEQIHNDLTLTSGGGAATQLFLARYKLRACLQVLWYRSFPYLTVTAAAQHCHDSHSFCEESGTKAMSLYTVLYPKYSKPCPITRCGGQGPLLPARSISLDYIISCQCQTVKGQWIVAIYPAGPIDGDKHCFLFFITHEEFVQHKAYT